MSYCLNSDCKKPQNPDKTKFCLSCGTKLLLKDHYRAIKPIGQGGFGRTFLAVDEDRLEAACVIKQFLPSPQIQSNSAAMAKATGLFEQEARQLLELGEQHLQIPALLAYFEQDRRLYLVQRFIQGQNLLQELEEQGAYTENQIRELLADLLPILKFVHDRYVIHRDIKPENIIRRNSDRKLVLIDFGISKYLSATALTAPGTTAGTPGYAPAEQMQYGEAYPASDLYSLGATCIHLLSAAHPLQLFNPLLGRWLWREKLVQTGVAVSDDLGEILDKLLKDLVPERYQSVEEVLKDLNTLPPQFTPQSPPPVPPQYRKQSFSQPQPNSTSKAHNSPPAPQRQTENWRCVHTLTGSSGWFKFFRSVYRSVAFSPDGQTLATGSSDKTIKLWLTSSGKLIHTLTGHSDSVSSVAFSPDGQTLATGSSDKTIKLWLTSSGKLIHTLTGHSDAVHSVAFSPDGQTLASGSMDNTIKLWLPSSGKLIHTLTGHSVGVYSVAFSPDGQTLASGSLGRTIELWLPSSGKLIHTLTGHSHAINPVAFSPDGQTLASGSGDNTIKLWLPSSGKLIDILIGHSDWVDSVAFSPDGQTLASGSWDNTIKIWRCD